MAGAGDDAFPGDDALEVSRLPVFLSPEGKSSACASGDPVGGKRLKSFINRLVWRGQEPPQSKADVSCPEERGGKRIRNQLSRFFA